MKLKTLLTSVGFFAFALNSWTQNTANDGDWKSRNVTLKNTAEAELMIRVGDIDNLGFGWADNYDPFSGKDTDAHGYPWTQEEGELQGLDMIMLPSSMNTGDASCGGDGYSAVYDSMIEQYKGTVFPIEINLPLEGVQVRDITMQLFIDDFQAPVFCSKFEVYLNNRRAVFIENVLNQVNQTGPVGKLITVKIPVDFLDEFRSGKVNLLIDDKTTGAHDGFAIDFVKILINPKAQQRSGSVKGILVDKESGNPIVGATVTIEGFGSSLTNENGEFEVTDLPAGLNIATVCVIKYRTQAFQFDIIEQQKTDVRLEMDPN